MLIEEMSPLRGSYAGFRLNHPNADALGYVDFAAPRLEGADFSTLNFAFCVVLRSEFHP